MIMVRCLTRTLLQTYRTMIFYSRSNYQCHIFRGSVGPSWPRRSGWRRSSSRGHRHSMHPAAVANRRLHTVIFYCRYYQCRSGRGTVGPSWPSWRWWSWCRRCWWCCRSSSRGSCQTVLAVLVGDSRGHTLWSHPDILLSHHQSPAVIQVVVVVVGRNSKIVE